jgi:hypothetical protein
MQNKRKHFKISKSKGVLMDRKFIWCFEARSHERYFAVSDFLLLIDVNEWFNKECAECKLPFSNVSHLNHL